MYSSREYRDAAGSNIKLPKEVYYRCLWTVRDSDRLRLVASVLCAGSESGPDNSNSEDDTTCMSSDGGTILVTEDTAERAAFELDCIDRALNRIPEVYREGLLDNILHKTDFGDFAHPNTWKRWKLVFLYELAKELHLI